MAAALARYLRFLFGLAIIGWIFVGMPWLLKADIVFGDIVFNAFIFLGMVPVCFLAYPALIVALYLMVTSRLRARADTLALIVAGASLYAVYGFAQGSEMMGATHRAGSPGEAEQVSDIRGDAILKVTVVSDRKQPVANLEIAIGERADGPGIGGVQRTDPVGVATFSLRPGSYYLGIGMTNYPQEVELPDFRPFRMEMAAGKVNEQTITLKAK